MAVAGPQIPKPSYTYYPKKNLGSWSIKVDDSKMKDINNLVVEDSAQDPMMRARAWTRVLPAI